MKNELNSGVEARDPLGARLREEAMAAGPAFSPELHGRIVGTLRARGMAERAGAGDAPAGWPGLRIGVSLAAAAAVALVAWMGIHSTPSGGRVEGPRPGIPDLVPHELVAPMRDAFAPSGWEGKYGYLDKDARRLATFVADQIPSFPVAR
jgi:hypothetical protein